MNGLNKTPRKSMQPPIKLGCCYYPEHWSPDDWAKDAKNMVAMGLSLVRIGEFAWSNIQPTENAFDWNWLDVSIDILGRAGLKVILGTPSATPPRWVLDKFPDMLALDQNGNQRIFGSRRHYCFSSLGYKTQAATIAATLAQRYKDNKTVAYWQIDNEYGCHNTTLSYSQNARNAFRIWLQNKYKTIDNLNVCWGNNFWSMNYNHFDQIDLPNNTVSHCNPIHQLDFRRFSSDQVVLFNREQVIAIKKYSDKPLIHNYMGCEFDIDLNHLQSDLDIASWDAYPLGHLEKDLPLSDAIKKEFYQQGDPDFQAFHHDLYRMVGNGKWWVMEQQSGPVNWARWNPAPLPGMVKLWTIEALAHGAEAVCYFRWRQAYFGQEQMHSGLQQVNKQPTAICDEIKECVDVIAELQHIEQTQAEVAIVFDYQSQWAWEIEPQGEDFDYFTLAYSYYRCLRQLGLTIDLLPRTATNFNDYKLVIIPALMHLPRDLINAIDTTSATVLIGPRTALKNKYFQINADQKFPVNKLPFQINCVESLRPSIQRQSNIGGAVHKWFEHIQCLDPEVTIEATVQDKPLWLSKDNLHYLAGWANDTLLHTILKTICTHCAISIEELEQGVRVRQTKNCKFIFNYNAHSIDYHNATMQAASVVWR